MMHIFLITYITNLQINSAVLLGQKVCRANNAKFILCIYYKLYFPHFQVVLSAVIMPETSFILCFVVPDINRNMKI